MGFLLELAWRTPITVVMSVISFLVYLLMTDLKHRLLRRRLQKQFEEYAKRHGHERECVLILSVIHNIHEAVFTHMEKEKRSGIPVFQVHRPEGLPEAEDAWFAYLEQVKQQVQKIREYGASRVYLFTNVPVALAVMIGATLGNGPEVVVHHHSAPAGYKAVGRLTVATVRL